ncbi:DnaD domain protein [Companilactobacillus furfuricola]|uniref:DnaD domain protein n=1 Tax=Companilactobacillus furfuricola TaxID=1462575 RepID=UPI000F785E47|nr:DnaD domain protein [Companilactobacillus furfuricola]
MPAGSFGSDDQQVLTDLYLPLIGAKAFSIYQFLWQKVPNKQIITDRESHATLMSLLDMDLSTFVNERLKLEAMHLIKSFVKSDDIGEFYIYQLYTPYTADQFLTDDILSVFLYEKIGETQYRSLVNKYSHSDELLKGAREISKNFMSIFHVSNDDLVKRPETVAKAQGKFTNSPEHQPFIPVQDVKNFDFSLVETRATDMYHVSHESILKNQELILSLHEFYDIPEIAMINLIGETMNIVDNSIDPNALKNAAQKRFEGKANLSARVESQPLQQPSQPLRASDPNLLLVQRAKSLSPADFLAEEKQQRGGFVGSSESRSLRTLAYKRVLPTAVLNIMTHYILQTSPSLTTALMETVANDWTQNGVKTPEDALKRINDFQNRPRGKRRYNNAPRKIEKGTDWSKVKSKPVTNKNSSEAEKSRQEMLRKLRNKDK